MSKFSKISLFSILLLLAICISPCFGAWIETKKEGDLIIATDTHWKTNTTNTDWSVARLYYEQTVSNLTYWYFEHQITKLENGSYWWLDKDVETETWFELHSGSHIVKIVVSGRGTQELWWYERVIGIHVVVDDVFQWMSKTYKTDLPIFRIWVWKNGTNCKIAIRVYYSDYTLHEGYDGSFDFGETWFSSVTLKQLIEKWGCGWIEAYKEDESIISNEEQSPQVGVAPKITETWIESLIRYVGNAWKGLGDILPEPIRGFMHTIGEIFTPAWHILSLAFGIVKAFIPYATLFYALYLVGLITTCISKLTIDPLFEHLLTLFSLFAQIISAVTGIVKTIWGFIKFW